MTLRPSETRSDEPGASVDSLLRTSASLHPDRPALIFGDHELDYRALDDAVEGLAGRIAAAAAGADLRGRRIAIVAPNTPALVVAMFAAWRLGAVAVPLNARLRELELRQILGDAEPSVLVTVRSHLGYSFVDLLPRLTEELPALHRTLLVDDLGLVEEETAGAPSPPPPEPLAAEIAAILYTSGTTGRPKGALVKHVREVEGAPRLASILALTPGEVAVFVIPISHAFGLACLLASFAAGGAALLVESTFSLEPTLTAIERHRATVLHGSPSLFTSLLKTRPNGVPGLRTGFVAGAPAPPELFERLAATGMTILNLYGLTETGALASCRPEDPVEMTRTTVGRPLPTFEVRVAPTERAEPPAGELQIRGPYITPGYHRRPEETARAFVDGWFRTGDLASIEDGYVRISGREKELVHVAGFNVFPAEVENALLGHPDVVQVAVVGVPSEAMGESLEAFVVARSGSSLTPAALLGFARERIAGYKLPYAINMVAELPLLASGKPDRVALTELASSSRSRGARREPAPTRSA
jgi:acyl-CoA synthetase (AMP-forming)/AMP-acid ligase II